MIARVRTWGVLGMLVCAVAACNSGDGSGAADPSSPPITALPERITCGTQYRPHADTLDGAEEPTIVVDRVDGLSGAPVVQEFDTMTLHVSYTGDAPEGRTVVVAVTGSDGSALTSALYQLGELSISEIAFSGGHGFTGLHSVHLDDAMLQFWCTA